jgi:hypothetical protein
VTGQTVGVRRALALLATIVCGVLAVGNGLFFVLVLITKAVILFSGWQPITAIVIFGANTWALGWLALQASRQVAPRRASAQH